MHIFEIKQAISEKGIIENLINGKTCSLYKINNGQSSCAHIKVFALEWFLLWLYGAGWGNPEPVGLLTRFEASADITRAT